MIRFFGTEHRIDALQDIPVLKHRLLSGTILILLLLLLAWLDQTFAHGNGPIGRGLLLAIFTAGLIVPLLVLEISAILKRVGMNTSTWIALLGAILLCLGMWISTTTAGDAGLTIPAAILVVVFVAAFVDGTRGERPRGVISCCAGTLFTVAYAGGLIGFWLMLRQVHGAWVILGAILTVKMSDIGAYGVGCSIGQYKLIPWLSPKKTWEGLLGGILAGGLSGGLLAWASHCLPEPDHYSIAWGVVFGVSAALVGLFGDLIASAMKRDAGVKDSSTILPGLGGVVDTMDSLLLVGPLAWWMLA